MGVSPRYNENREYENLVNEIRVEQGLTLKELASKIGICQGQMWNISQGYTGPYWYRSGKLKDWAIKLQEIFGYHLSEIFPREVCNIQTSNLTNDQLAYIAHGYVEKTYGDSSLDRLEKHMSLREGVKLLTQREKLIMHYRHELDQEFSYISKVIGIGTVRCRQIEWTCFKILRGYISKSVGIGKSVGEVRDRWYTGWLYQRMRQIRKGQISLQPEYPYSMLIGLLPKNSIFRE